MRLLCGKRYIIGKKICSLFIKYFNPLFIIFSLCSRNEEYDKEILVNIAVDFLETILDSGIFYAEEIILTFLTDSDITTWIAETTGIIIYGEVITGELHVSSLDQNIQIHQKCMSIDLTSNTITDNTESCLKWALFNINLLNNLCLRSISKCKTEESSTEELLIHNLNLPGATNLLITVIYSIILGELYSKHYKSVSIVIACNIGTLNFNKKGINISLNNYFQTKCYNNVNKTLVTVQDSFKQLQIYINEDTFNEIRDYITMYVF